MELFPAIDLRQGKVVRLLQGERDQQTVYATDPVEVAAAFVAEGSRWLHVVNLDGAFADTPDGANQAALKRLLENRGDLFIQVGGGLRSLQDLDALLELGASRAIIGSQAINDPDLVRDAVDAFGSEQIVVGIDARGGVESGEVKTRGWTEGGAMTPLVLAQRMVDIGVNRFIYTDISKDGMQTGPDSEGAAMIARKTGAEVIISGGVGEIGHLASAAALSGSAHPGRLDGVVVGKAIYENVFSVSEALAVLRPRS